MSRFARTTLVKRRLFSSEAQEVLNTACTIRKRQKWCKREEMGTFDLQSRLQRQQQLCNSWYMRCVMGSLNA